MQNARERKDVNVGAGMSVETILLLVLAGFTVFFCFRWLAALRRRWVRTPTPASRERIRPSAAEIITGFVTDFFDTLGVGSFATTTTIYKIGRLVPDEAIPGTMNTGHTLPTILEAFIYISFVKVEFVTLIVLLGSAVLGAWLGANIVTRISRRAVQLGIGLALLVSLSFMFMGQLRLFPVGGELLGLRGLSLAIGALGNSLLGALSSLGIGFYAPCMVLVSLLGMNPLAAYPIMMGSAACLMPVASTRFIQANAYRPAPALGLTIGGLPAVVLAAFLVKSLPLTTVRWLVMAIVFCAAILLLKSAAESGIAGKGSQAARGLSALR
jgi:uncharacterized membrane protein YfcA